MDTSALIASLAGRRTALPALRQLLDRRDRLRLSSLVLYEWRRGPRNAEELADQEKLFPSDAAVAFGFEEAMAAARLYNQLRNPRNRELDIAIAACAIRHEAALWTLNRRDFADIPGLTLVNLD